VKINECFPDNFLYVHLLTVLKQESLNKAVFRLGPSELRELRELRLSVVPVCPRDKERKNIQIRNIFNHLQSVATLQRRFNF
jgi:hypothetical protein